MHPNWRLQVVIAPIVLKYVKSVHNMKRIMFSSFLKQDILDPSLNITWVTLVPKKSIATEVRDYRPISMVGSVYKVIAKIMSRRLREVLPKLVGETQSAFVKDRQILDGALIANETVNWLRKKKKSSILLKLDFEKAYDTIDWVSMDMVLKEMGLVKNGENGLEFVQPPREYPYYSMVLHANHLKWGEGLDKGIPYQLFCLC